VLPSKPFDPNAAAAPDSGLFGLNDTPEQAEVVVLPVPFEVTTSYGGGTARGPAAVLHASHQVDLFDVETGRPYQAGIALLDEPREVREWNRWGRQMACPVIDAGGAGDDPELLRKVGQVNDLCTLLNAHVYATARHWLLQGKLVGVLGGDHGVPFGAIRAAAEHHETEGGIGVLHIDAHADLRRAYEGFTWSHASIMDNVVARVPQVTRLVQVAIRDLCEEEFLRIHDSGGRIVTFFDADLARRQAEGERFAEICQEIVGHLPQRVYVSFDIDGLDPALCPHTGTPVPGGLSFAQASLLLRTLAQSGRRIVAFDLNEVAPSSRWQEPAPGEEGESQERSAADEWDANVGARILYKMIGWALKSRSPDQGAGAASGAAGAGDAPPSAAAAGGAAAPSAGAAPPSPGAKTNG
jgi:agmatinase